MTTRPLILEKEGDKKGGFVFKLVRKAKTNEAK